MNALTLSRIAVSGLVLAHLWIVVGHGEAHDALGVGLPPLETFFVYAVILTLPLLGAAATWTRYLVPALWVVALSFAGATVFGVYHHYILVSPDNIAHLPEGPAPVREAFVSSAGYLALIELVASGVALYLAGYWTARGMEAAPAARPAHA